MHKFIPFEEFKQQLETARHKESQTSSPPPAEPQAGGQPEVTPENLREMSDYLAAQHRKMQVVHSFLGDDGQYIDCVKADTQPGLQPGQHVATPPAFITNSGSAQPSVPGDGSRKTSPKVDQFGNVMECPAGCIPVRRVTLAEIARAGSMANYFQKAPGGGALPPSPGTV